MVGILTGVKVKMSNTNREAPSPAVSPFGWHELKGEPKPGIEDFVDDAIYKVMVAQRREINRKNLPELDS